MEMGQEGSLSRFELGSGGVSGFQQVAEETLAGQPIPLVQLAYRSLEDEQAVPHSMQSQDWASRSDQFHTKPPNANATS
ncbi:hypothetical protein Plim_1598 [Planctopirus limnophila DSM 3776]|uniref:Uncharacterized protein n=1 Tax=Planctopirus limnophila (strain ATCC 43296 / DSM 3776 / IFAM 1008 / Mu 290) TaxID=521674 RepID=D5SWT1_PLAL2|nr:hypothetical protein Plim_1598 [Planctopirus limnophila DSM 3776]